MHNFRLKMHNSCCPSHQSSSLVQYNLRFEAVMSTVNVCLTAIRMISYLINHVCFFTKCIERLSFFSKNWLDKESDCPLAIIKGVHVVRYALLTAVCSWGHPFTSNSQIESLGHLWVACTHFWQTSPFHLMIVSNRMISSWLMNGP